MAKGLTGKDKELADKIKALLIEHGYRTTKYHVSYSVLVDGPASVVGDPVGVDREPGRRIAEDYKSHCRLYGLEPEWLGMEFTYRGQTCKVIGLFIRPRKTTEVLFTYSDKSGKFLIGTQALKQHIVFELGQKVAKEMAS
jgi:hypothetical protein